jgi:putative transposase
MINRDDGGLSAESSCGWDVFLTITLRDRSAELLTRYVDCLRDAYATAQRRRPFETVAVCVLPDHFHVVWALPEGDADYSSRVSHLKGRFVRLIEERGFVVERNAEGDEVTNVWQSRFWEHTVRDERDLQNHVDYVHFNPVKHKFATCASDWPHSSIHRYIKRGEMAVDWASDVVIDCGE